MKNILVLFSVFHLVIFSILGQENVLYFEVQQAKSANVHFENIIFQEISANTEVFQNFDNPNEVSFFENVSFDAKNSHIKAMNLTIPIPNNRNIVLELVEVPEYFYNYEVVTEDGARRTANRDIKHYHGVVRGETNTLVAITFYEDEIMGLVCTDEGNFNIAKDSLSGKHLFYNGRNLKDKTSPTCITVDNPSLFYDPKVLFKERNRLRGDGSIIQDPVINKIVRFYVETKVDMYRRLGRDHDKVEAYISGLFNQVAALYLNVGIRTCVSEVYVWSGSDPYSGVSAGSLLIQFQDRTPSINGDLGILLTFRGKDNGYASISFDGGLCNPSTREKLAVATGLKREHETVPVYCRTVQLVTHELGHLFGLRHTHACVWNGDSTAIDGCGGIQALEPSWGGIYCPWPGYPLKKGTIMSYCDSDGPGIDFNLGFGPQPGNVIREKVLNASCLGCYIPESFTNQIITTNMTIIGCENLTFQDVTITNGAVVDIYAEEKVTLKPDFHATAGTTVTISVGTTTNTTMASYNILATTDGMTLEDPNLQNLTTSSTDFTHSRLGFKLYPNPNNGKFQLDANFPLTDIGNLKILNLLGVTVYETQNLTSNIIQLPTSATGTFFVVMILKDGTVLTQKMVVQ